MKNDKNMNIDWYYYIKYKLSEMMVDNIQIGKSCYKVVKIDGQCLC